MRILLTGASGLLGRYLLEGAPQGFEVFTVSRNSRRLTQSGRQFQLDLTDFREVAEVFREVVPDVVIHAAAEGNVDKVEAEPDHFRLINVLLPEFLARHAADRGAQFVHISSNAVFGGRSTPYSDFDASCPINTYGQLKAEAEESVLTANPESAIVRPILMYGWPNEAGRSNIAKLFIEKLAAGQGVKALTDITTQPLYAADGAEVVWKVVRKGARGPFNVSGGQTLSIYEFGLLIADVFEFDRNLVQPVTFGDLHGLSPRPASTMFSMERLDQELSFSPRPPRAGLIALYEEVNGFKPVG